MISFTRSVAVLAAIFLAAQLGAAAAAEKSASVIPARPSATRFSG
jgi:hypothetical protein